MMEKVASFQVTRPWDSGFYRIWTISHSPDDWSLPIRYGFGGNQGAWVIPVDSPADRKFETYVGRDPGRIVLEKSKHGATSARPTSRSHEYL